MDAVAAEHGVLGLSSPWARAAIPSGYRKEIEALIPAGYTIGVSGQAHGGGQVFVLWALGPGVDPETGRPPELLRWRDRHDPVNAARAIARRLQELAAA